MTELPATWANAKFSDFGTWIGGGTPSKANPHFWNGPIPWVSPKDMKTKIIRGAIDGITEEAVENSAAKLVPAGSVLIVTRSGILAHTLPIAVTAVESTLNQDLKALALPDGIGSEYIAWGMRAFEQRILDKCRKGGTTVHSIEMPRLASFELPIAPSNEQRRIVEKIEAMFDEIDKGVESLQTARTTLGLYRQSLLNSAYQGRLTADWRAQNGDKRKAPETLLARIQRERDTRYETALDAWQDALTAWRAGGEKGKRPAKPRRDAEPDAPMSEQRALMNGIPPEWQWLQIGTFGFVTKLAGFEYTKHVIYREDGDLPVIKAENAGKSSFKVTDYSRVRSEEVAMLTRSFLNGGELLMVFVGAGTGQVATVPTDQRYFLGPNIGMIRLETPDILPKFVEHYLRSPIGTSMKLASVKAVAQPSLSMGTIRQIPVAVPSPAEQAEIVRRLDARLEAAEALEAEIDATLTRADALRQSILKKAFSGQLVPQDPEDEPASDLLERIKVDRAKAPKAKKRRSAHA